jgi:hypothetical protein
MGNDMTQEADTTALIAAETLLSALFLASVQERIGTCEIWGVQLVDGKPV